MGATKIEWVRNSDGTKGETWNPVTGCDPLSAGCEHCYARRMANRLRGRFGYPAEEPFSVTLHPDRLGEPYHWKKPRQIFVCSMGDLFHCAVRDDFLDDVWEVMEEMNHHTYMILTKRPYRMAAYLNRWHTRPIEHIWLGTTVENQEALPRVECLLNCPAAVRFLSLEPLLGPLDLRLCPDPEDLVACERGHGDDSPVAGIPCPSGRHWVNFASQPRNCLDWVICGGETGPGARPMHPAWVRSIRDQCVKAGVPFFFKGWGDYISWEDCPHELLDKPRIETGEGMFIRVGKARAGRLLDGREWDEVPRAR